MDLSIVTVTTNALKHIGDCLHSIYETTPPPELEVIVSDNASTDGTVEFIREQFPQVVVIQNGENLGFGTANNRGAKESTGRYIMFLNDDTRILPGSLAKMIEFMDANPDIAVLGPKLLNADGTLQSSIENFPSMWRDVFRILLPRGGLEYDTLIIRNFLKKCERFFGLKLGHLSDHSKITEVSAIGGACLLTRPSVIGKVGGFDENIFLYSDEIEWCYRIHQAGCRIVYYPEAEIVHLGGITQGKEITNHAPTRLFIQKHKSNLYFFEKHSNKFNVVVYKLGVAGVFVFRSILLTLQYFLAGSERRKVTLTRREAYLKTARLLLDSHFRRQNIFTEMRFQHLN